VPLLSDHDVSPENANSGWAANLPNRHKEMNHSSISYLGQDRNRRQSLTAKQDRNHWNLNH